MALAFGLNDEAFTFSLLTVGDVLPFAPALTGPAAPEPGEGAPEGAGVGIFLPLNGGIA